MAKTHGGKSDRIPGANPAAYEAGYPAIDWNAREAVRAFCDGETVKERRRRLFRESVILAVILGCCALAVAACFAVKAIMVLHG
jgi:hypothetical protein